MHFDYIFPVTIKKKKKSLYHQLKKLFTVRGKIASPLLFISIYITSLCASVFKYFIILTMDLSSCKTNSSAVQRSTKLMGLKLLAAWLNLVQHLLVARKLLAMSVFNLNSYYTPNGTSWAKWSEQWLVWFPSRNFGP